MQFKIAATLTLLTITTTTVLAETKAYTATGEEAPKVNTATGTVSPAPEQTGAQTNQQLGASDASISTEVQKALAQDPSLTGSNIKAISAGGSVTLDGMVNNQMQADRALQIAKSVSGVKDVQSKLTITTPGAATQTTPTTPPSTVVIIPAPAANP